MSKILIKTATIFGLVFVFCMADYWVPHRTVTGNEGMGDGLMVDNLHSGPAYLARWILKLPHMPIIGFLYTLGEGNSEFDHKLGEYLSWLAWPFLLDQWYKKEPTFSHHLLLSFITSLQSALIGFFVFRFLPWNNPKT